MAAIKTYLEVTEKRAFASAADWPGWCRAGKTHDVAIETLLAYAPRYQAVVSVAGLKLSSKLDVDMVERKRGDATTEFGAPGQAMEGETVAPTAAKRARTLTLLKACWEVFDDIAAKSPEELRKGPRGGGRDRTKMTLHVLEAEAGYSRYLGLRLPSPGTAAAAVAKAQRDAILEALSTAGSARESPDGKRRWPFAYAVRRIAWHTMDHAWEMEDRRGPRKAEEA